MKNLKYKNIYKAEGQTCSESSLHINGVRNDYVMNEAVNQCLYW